MKLTIALNFYHFSHVSSNSFIQFLGKTYGHMYLPGEWIALHMWCRTVKLTPRFLKTLKNAVGYLCVKLTGWLHLLGL